VQGTSLRPPTPPPHPPSHTKSANHHECVTIHSSWGVDLRGEVKMCKNVGVINDAVGINHMTGTKQKYWVLEYERGMGEKNKSINGLVYGKILTGNHGFSQWNTVDGCEILHHQKDGWNLLNSGMFTIYQLVMNGFRWPIHSISPSQVGSHLMRDGGINGPWLRGCAGVGAGRTRGRDPRSSSAAQSSFFMGLFKPWNMVISCDLTRNYPLVICYIAMV